MALVVEDGTGKTDSESYTSVSSADSYFSDRGVAAWAALTEAEKEQSLRKATDYMVAKYRDRWRGYSKTYEQALDWPRDGVVVDGWIVENDIVPVDVQRATMELALKASSDDLAPDLDRGGDIKRLKADTLEIEYADGASPHTVFRQVEMLLSSYLKGASGSTAPLVRV